MTIFGDLTVATIGQTTDLTLEELTPARALAAALLALAGNANGREFVEVAVQITGQPDTERAGIELVGLAAAVQSGRRDEQALRSSGDQPAMKHEAKSAGFRHRVNGVALGDPLLDLFDELVGRELARRLRGEMTVLGHGHDEL